ncbi:MAG: hypothetical protein K0A99_00840 [Desulfoarculaceae bacterium]|nr:hypothetical protein [Desulfoarculaceae bacterium]
MATRSEIYALFYSGDVAVKLAAAQELYSQYGKVLALRPDIMAQLAALAASEHALQTRMGAMGMGNTCTQCASRPGGGCCSRFMTGENDVLQLLMNLLAGVQVTIQQDGPVECCFLGVAGCVLVMKPMFCLNYNCSQIKGKEDGPTLIFLEQRTGELLRKQAVLEDLLIDFFCENLCRGLGQPLKELGSSPAMIEKLAVFALLS